MVMKLDIANAFGSIDRAKACDLIVQALRTQGPAPEWLGWPRRYLCQPTYIIPPHCDGEALCTHDGIAQGDPASALIFGTALALHMSNLQDTPFLGIYIDDVCVAADVDHGPALLHRIGSHLAERGLTLQPGKTKTLLPPEMPPDQLLAPDLRSIRHTFSPGLKICEQCTEAQTTFVCSLLKWHMSCF